MMKKLFLLGVIFLFVISSSYAFDEIKGYQWLNKTLVEGTWDFEVEELSLGILALKQKGYDVSDGIDVLERKKIRDSWDGRIKDSALAILALSQNGKDVSNEIEWLKNAIIEARVRGDWLIQINAHEGSCVVSYQDREKTFRIVDDKFVDCYNDYWIDVEKCISSSLGAYEEIFVDCSDGVDGSPEISLLYREGDVFRVMPQQGVIRTSLILESGCYGTKEGSSTCDFKSTAFASWILRILGESDVYTSAYLTSSLDERADNYALVYLVTSEDSYASWLASKQLPSGSWDSDVYRSALAILALRQGYGYSDEIDGAVEWLGSKQKRDGYFGSDRTMLLDTAMVLYGVFATPGGGDVGQPVGSGYCGDFVVNEGEECELDVDCDPGYECVRPGKIDECTCKEEVVEDECSLDKPCGSGFECVRGVCERIGCIDNSECGIGEECVNSVCVEKSGCEFGDCRIGEECVSGRCIAIPDWCFYNSDCDPGEKCENNSCVEKGSSFMNILIIVVIILLLGVGGYFALRKFSHKKPKEKPRGADFILRREESPLKPVKRQQPANVVRQRESRDSYQDTKIEKELDESLRKARELLGKK